MLDTSVWMKAGGEYIHDRRRVRQDGGFAGRLRQALGHVLDHIA